MGGHFDPVPHGVAVRLRPQIAGHFPEIFKIIRIHPLDSRKKYRDRPVSQFPEGEPAPKRASEQLRFPEGCCFLLIEPFIGIPASACVHSVRDLIHFMSQDPHGMDPGGVAVWDRIRRADDVGHRPVPGICIFNTCNRAVSSSAAAVHIAIGPVLISIDLLRLFPGILRCRRTGTVRHRVVIAVCENGGGTHVCLYKISAVGERERDLVIPSGQRDRRDLLVRPRKRRKVLVKPSLILLLLRIKEREPHGGPLEAAVDVAERDLCPVREFSGILFIYVNKSILEFRIQFCVINCFHNYFLHIL